MSKSVVGLPCSWTTTWNFGCEILGRQVVETLWRMRILVESLPADYGLNYEDLSEYT